MFVVTLTKRRVLKIFALLAAVALAGSCAFFIPSANEGVQLPILMYHAVLKDPGRTGDYVVTPRQLEQDMRSLKRNGYTTVFMRDVIAYAQEGKPLPEKPVVLSFDDGHLNNLTYLYPLLRQYDMRAVIAPVGAYTEQYSSNPDPSPAYAYLTWDDLAALSQSGLVEILNHTYNMHKQQGRHGAQKIPGETAAHYEQAFTSDVGQMQQALREHCGITASTFVYPFGQMSDESQPLVEELGFAASLSCRERVNTVTRNPACLYQLGRFNRSGRYTSDQIMKKAGIRE